jgi:hypothetical protein
MPRPLMATSLRKELAYDAGPDAVAAMLVDASFREEVLARMRVLRGSATVADKVVTIEQVQSADGIPSFARKIVGDEIDILQVEDWSAGHTADVRVTIPGKPGDMSGTARLVPAGGQTLEVVELTITVGIPLVAGKIEKLVADMLHKALDKEHEVGREWLAR